jgi:hypothetical protein
VLPLRNVPHSNRAIFTIGNNELVLGMKEDAGDVVSVTSHGVDLPCLYKEKRRKEGEYKKKNMKRKKKKRRKGEKEYNGS